jgi:hypothetical protein
MFTEAKAGAVVDKMTAVAAATEAACARGKCVYTRRDRRRASTTTPRVSRLAPFVVVVVVASPNSNSNPMGADEPPRFDRSTDPRSRGS